MADSAIDSSADASYADRRLAGQDSCWTFTRPCWSVGRRSPGRACLRMTCSNHRCLPRRTRGSLQVRACHPMAGAVPSVPSVKEAEHTACTPTALETPSGFAADHMFTVVVCSAGVEKVLPLVPRGPTGTAAGRLCSAVGSHSLQEPSQAGVPQVHGRPFCAASQIPPPWRRRRGACARSRSGPVAPGQAVCYDSFYLTNPILM